MKKVQLLTENLGVLGHEVFSYVKDERNFVSAEDLENDKGFEGKDWKTAPEVRQAYEKDIEGLRSSDAFIMMLPAGNSSHIEAGIAFALGKKTILIGNPDDCETHYLIFEEHYENIEQCIANTPRQ